MSIFFKVNDFTILTTGKTIVQLPTMSDEYPCTGVTIYVDFDVYLNVFNYSLKYILMFTSNFSLVF